MKKPPLVFNINENPPSTLEIESSFSMAESSRNYALMGGLVLLLGSHFCYFVFFYPLSPFSSQPPSTLGMILTIFGVLLGYGITFKYGAFPAGGYWLQEHADNERLDGLKYQASLHPEIAQYMAKVPPDRKLTLWEVDNLFRFSANPTESFDGTPYL